MIPAPHSVIVAAAEAPSPSGNNNYRNPVTPTNLFNSFLSLVMAARNTRGMGVHISFVRSVKMDSWTDKQIKAMKLGGNGACNEYLRSKGSIARDAAIKEKYDNNTAQLYKLQLKAKVEGTPIPTELPKPKPRKNDGPSKYQGFGSSPPPPPSSRKSPLGAIVGVAVTVVVGIAFMLLKPAEAKIPTTPILSQRFPPY